MYYFEEHAPLAKPDACLMRADYFKISAPDAAYYEVVCGSQNSSRMEGHELIVPAVSPRAPTLQMLACAALALEFDVRCIPTFLRQRWKLKICAENNMPVIPMQRKQLLRQNAWQPCVHRYGEIKTLANHRVGVANPSLNLKLASGLPQ
jgi:hypothetical protein